MFFDKELGRLTLKEMASGCASQRIPLTENELCDILNKYPNVPIDYINYLKEVGHGSIMCCQFNVYSGLVDYIDFEIDIMTESLCDLKLFGDNFAGDLAGFDLSSKNPNEVIEFWHDSNELFFTGMGFREYIISKMLL